MTSYIKFEKHLKNARVKPLKYKYPKLNSYRSYLRSIRPYIVRWLDPIYEEDYINGVSPKITLKKMAEKWSIP